MLAGYSNFGQHKCERLLTTVPRRTVGRKGGVKVKLHKLIDIRWNGVDKFQWPTLAS